MQPAYRSRHPLLQASKEEEHKKSFDKSLQFPTLPVNSTVEDWLENSSLVLEAPPLQRRSTMVLRKNKIDPDPPMEGSVSSVDDGAWDIVDEESAASDDLDSIQRQPTPFSGDERAENTDYGTSSFMSTGSTSESHVTDSDHDEALHFSQTANDGGFDFVGSDAGIRHRRRSGSTTLPRDTYFAFPYNAESFALSGPSKTRLRCVIKRLDDPKYLELFHDQPPKGMPYTVNGCLSQTASRNYVNLDNLEEPFTLAYFGPNEMKPIIAEKIGSALAAPLHSASSEDVDPSRVTVVPVSSFGAEGSPEVTLIESSGIEMRIRECTMVRSGGHYVEFDGRHIVVTKNQPQAQEKGWSSSTMTSLPHFAVFYLSEDPSEDEARMAMCGINFSKTHKIPYLCISPDTPWEQSFPFFYENATTDGLHRVIELKSKWFYHPVRRPINLSSFLALDSSQMNRNMASLMEGEEKRRNSDSCDNFCGQSCATFVGKVIRKIEHLLQVNDVKNPRQVMARAFFGFFLTLVTVLYLSSMTTPYIRLVDERYVIDSTVHKDVNNLTPVKPVSNVMDNPMSTASYFVPHAQQSIVKDLLATEKKEASNSEQDIVSLFQVQKLGESNIIIKAPRWFTDSKRSPRLHFRITRNGDLVPHEKSIIAKGIVAFHVPDDEAHGKLKIRIWTEQKPLVQETLYIDLGHQWLTMKGFQQFAEGVVGQAQENFQNLYKSLSDSELFDQERIQSLAAKQFEEATKLAKELAKTSGKTAFSRSKVAYKAARKAAKQASKDMSKSIQRHWAKEGKQVKKLLRKQMKDLDASSRRYGVLLHQQAQELARIAAETDWNEVSRKQQRRLRDMQKKALHVWWKVRGPPEGLFGGGRGKAGCTKKKCKNWRK